MLSPLLVALGALHGPTPAQEPPMEAPDRVVLEDGRELVGRVLREDEAVVVVRVGGERRELSRARVTEVTSIERSVAALLDRHAARGRQDASHLAPLAVFCEHAHLPGEARGLWLRLLTIDAQDARAWRKLGGVETARGWRLQSGGHLLSLSELRERWSTWEQALSLGTAHFELRTDLPLERALDVALEVEGAYRALQSDVGAALELEVFDERPELHVHRRADEWPASDEPGRAAWFEEAAGRVHVDASADDAARDLMFQLARAVLHFSFGRSLGGRTTLPAWVERGLAERFAGGYRRGDGVAPATWRCAEPDAVLFARHARDPEPLSLARLLAAGEAAFVRGKDSGRHVAQATTLVSFLLDAQGGAGRAGFGRFVRGAAEGRATPQHLAEALGVEPEALERRWDAYVAQVAARER